MCKLRFLVISTALVALCALFFAAPSFAPSLAAANQQPVQPSAQPAAQGPAQSSDLPPGAMQENARAACTWCHDAQIITQQRLSKDAWGKEVDKMVRWGAPVSAEQRTPLIDYLSTNFPPDKPPAPPVKLPPAKTAPLKAAPAKAMNAG